MIAVKWLALRSHVTTNGDEATNSVIWGERKGAWKSFGTERKRFSGKPWNEWWMMISRSKKNGSDKIPYTNYLTLPDCISRSVQGWHWLMILIVKILNIRFCGCQPVSSWSPHWVHERHRQFAFDKPHLWRSTRLLIRIRLQIHHDTACDRNFWQRSNVFHRLVACLPL